MNEWDRTAAIVAKIHNANCAKAAQAIRDPSMLNPIRMAQARKKQPEPDPEDDAQALITAFVPNGQPRGM